MVWFLTRVMWYHPGFWCPPVHIGFTSGNEAGAVGGCQWDHIAVRSPLLLVISREHGSISGSRGRRGFHLVTAGCISWKKFEVWFRVLWFPIGVIVACEVQYALSWVLSVKCRQEFLEEFHGCLSLQWFMLQRVCCIACQFFLIIQQNKT